MTQRDQIAAPLGRLDAGDPSCCQGLTLGQLARLEELQRRLGRVEKALGHRPPSHGLLSRNVDHSDAAAIIQMRELVGHR